MSILGVGLLGGSLALAVKSVLSDCHIVGYGHRQDSLDRALQAGAIDSATLSPTCAVRDADLVVLCTPVGRLSSLLREIADSLKPDAILTDVGSTKRQVVATAETCLPSHVHFVGSHPMAGSEKRGVEYARADLFQHATCILTPTPQTDADALQKVSSFWQMLGMRVCRHSPEVHDRLLAFVSHLPHVLAAALVAAQPDEALDLAGKGFIDATRIASGDGALWRDILLDNADNLKAAFADLRERLTQLQAMLDAPDQAAALADWLDGAAARREALVQKKLRDLHAG